MNPSYIPVIAAKRGEFRALETLQASIADRIIPAFELPAQPDKTEFEKSISRTATAAGKAWKERPAFLDISKWRSNATTETGVHILEYAFSQFISAGVRTSPVIGYDRRDDPAYRRALRNIRGRHPIAPCLRFDREAIRDDMRDIGYFSDELGELLGGLDLDASNCYAMLDFQDVTSTSVPDMVDFAERGIRLLKSMGFKVVFVVGGSMPATVNGAVEERDAEGCVTRIEALTWKTIFSGSRDDAVVFGDYPIRNPVAPDGVIAPHANAKIRYTIKNQFFVVRGHTKREDSLGIQHQRLAEKLITSNHYADPSASWGDSQLQQCALGVIEIKDATAMIAIDTNRHIVAVVTEVFEHRVTVASV
jgi:hypothetical protein